MPETTSNRVASAPAGRTGRAAASLAALAVALDRVTAGADTAFADGDALSISSGRPGETVSRVTVETRADGSRSVTFSSASGPDGSVSDGIASAVLVDGPGEQAADAVASAASLDTEGTSAATEAGIAVSGSTVSSSASASGTGPESVSVAMSATGAAGPDPAVGGVASSENVSTMGSPSEASAEASRGVGDGLMLGLSAAGGGDDASVSTTLAGGAVGGAHGTLVTGSVSDAAAIGPGSTTGARGLRIARPGPVVSSAVVVSRAGASGEIVPEPVAESRIEAMGVPDNATVLGLSIDPTRLVLTPPTKSMLTRLGAFSGGAR